MFKQKKLWFVLILALLLAVGCATKEDSATDNGSENSDTNETEQEAGNEIPTVIPTDELDPDHPMTEAIQYGEEIFNETNTVLADYVGNELSCQSCHADGGLSP